MMRFEFDPEKNRLNKLRHGLDFHDAQYLWKADHFVIEVESRGESRSAILGMIHEEHYVAIFTMRGQNVRLISFHRADKRLVKIYEKFIKEK